MHFMGVEDRMMWLICMSSREEAETFVVTL